MAPGSDCPLQTTLRPEEGTTEHDALIKEYGFLYCQVLSKLMYAYVFVHCDIGYAVNGLLCCLSLLFILPGP